jgi:mannosyl-3-phosphoglycerate phosphatase
MFDAVDIPIIVQKPNGEYDPPLKLPKLSYADGVGPLGWSSSILKLSTNFD